MDQFDRCVSTTTNALDSVQTQAILTSRQEQGTVDLPKDVQARTVQWQGTYTSQDQERSWKIAKTRRYKNDQRQDGPIRPMASTYRQLDAAREDNMTGHASQEVNSRGRHFLETHHLTEYRISTFWSNILRHFLMKYKLAGREWEYIAIISSVDYF